jgi:GrpB-like predicted nucleotidyltransferase (UPF0157 family)
VNDAVGRGDRRALLSGPDVLAHARAIHARESARLRGLRGTSLELTGGSSVPGALTFGDVDLHLRVEPAAFAAVVDRLRSIYDVVHPEIWTDTLATFAVPGEEVGIAATPIGSEHDRRFVWAWRRLRDDPDLLRAYNAMKRSHRDAVDASYLRAKADFFGRPDLAPPPAG